MVFLTRQVERARIIGRSHSPTGFTVSSCPGGCQRTQHPSGRKVGAIG